MATGKVTKQPRERFYVGINVSAEIVDGDSLDAGNSKVYEYKQDSEGIYQAIAEGSEELVEPSTLRAAEGNVLEAAISEGVHGEKFKISFAAHTLGGDIFEGDIIVPIKEI